MDQRTPDLLRPTLTAGVIFGAAAAIPFLNFINCACCALIVGCGFFASRLYSGQCRRDGVSFSPGTGAMVGLVAGAFYAMTDSLLETAVRMAIGDPASRVLLSLLESLPSLPAENRDTIEQMLRQSAEASPTLGSFVMGFFVMVLVAAIFSTIGGLIGGAVYRYSPPPPSAPPVPDEYAPPSPPSAPAV